MTLNELTVNFAHIKREELLSDWQWLIGSDKLPVLVTASGDAFVQDATDGGMYVLDVPAGVISKVAENSDAFRELLSQVAFVRDYFAVEMVGDLRSQGVLLGHGQIYSFKKPPVLGGEYVLENIEVTDLSVHFSLAGQIHEKVRNLPPGTPVGDVAID